MLDERGVGQAVFVQQVVVSHEQRTASSNRPRNLAMDGIDVRHVCSARGLKRHRPVGRAVPRFRLATGPLGREAEAEDGDDDGGRHRAKRSHCTDEEDCDHDERPVESGSGCVVGDRLHQQGQHQSRDEQSAAEHQCALRADMSSQAVLESRRDRHPATIQQGGCRRGSLRLRSPQQQRSDERDADGHERQAKAGADVRRGCQDDEGQQEPPGDQRRARHPSDARDHDQRRGEEDDRLKGAEIEDRRAEAVGDRAPAQVCARAREAARRFVACRFEVVQSRPPGDDPPGASNCEREQGCESALRPGQAPSPGEVDPDHQGQRSGVHGCQRP